MIHSAMVYCAMIAAYASLRREVLSLQKLCDFTTTYLMMAGGKHLGS